IIDAVRVRRILKNEHKIAQKNGYRIFYRKKRKPSDKNEREYERMSEIADERPFPGSAAGNAAGAQGNVAHAASLRGSSGRILPA
ncbi:MAG: hypothetical protein IJM24_04805, partial [Clostridia bacterium]|nr:hypothetical protein [Clostridia bacterium]MBR7063411.1 hypothetical protein [Clostridia bacterium]